MIKILFFLQFYLNCWLLGNKTWSDDTSSEARVFSEKIGLLHPRSRSKQRVKMWMFVQMISSKPPNILFPDLVLHHYESECHAKRYGLLFSRSVSLQELIWSKCDNFLGIFWTANPFAYKVGLIVYYHKPEFFIEKLDCFVQGQGHSKIWRCQWLSTWYLLNHWTFYCHINMVMHHHEPDCLSKRLICCLQCQGHS